MVGVRDSDRVGGIAGKAIGVPGGAGARRVRRNRPSRWAARRAYAMNMQKQAEICNEYATNMQEICTNMHLICRNMQGICKEYARICNKYAKICKKYAYICNTYAKICT